MSDFEDCGVGFKLLYDAASSKEASELLMGALVESFLGDAKIRLELDALELAEGASPFVARASAPPRYRQGVAFLADAEIACVYWVQHCWHPGWDHSFVTVLPESRTPVEVLARTWDRLVSLVEPLASRTELAFGVGCARTDEPGGMEVPVRTEVLRAGRVLAPWTYAQLNASRPQYRLLADSGLISATRIGTGVALRPVARPGLGPSIELLKAVNRAELEYLDPLWRPEWALPAQRTSSV